MKVLKLMQSLGFEGDFGLNVGGLQKGLVWSWKKSYEIEPIQQNQNWLHMQLKILEELTVTY